MPSMVSSHFSVFFFIFSHLYSKRILRIFMDKRGTRREKKLKCENKKKWGMNKRTERERTNAKWKQLKMSWQRINHFRNNDLLSYSLLYTHIYISISSHPGAMGHCEYFGRCEMKKSKRAREGGREKIVIFSSPPPKMLFNDTKCDRWCKSWHWID